MGYSVLFGQRIFLCFLLFSLLNQPSAETLSPSDSHRRTLFSSLDPKSLKEQLAFHRQFQTTHEGKKALTQALTLLCPHHLPEDIDRLNFSFPLLEELVQIVTRPPEDQTLRISEEELTLLESITAHLPNRKLLGYRATTEEEVVQLPSEEIDLARALLLSQADQGMDLQLIRSYEAVFDLMALQILAKAKTTTNDQDVIEAINAFVFDEMRFRFPPHSVFVENIDLYTFLPSVVDSRRGVCLGVSILYLCLAQRLNLPLEIITPPGHIFVRYEKDGCVINIETTCRGIHIPDEHYLSLETKELEHRTTKEVVGMAHFNHASIFWQKQEFQKAINAYTKALPYMEDDPLLQELLGYNYLFLGEEEKGAELLRGIQNTLLDHQVVRSSIPEDYLLGRVDPQGILRIYQHIDESRDSILKKKELIEETLKAFPLFRAGWLQLAVLWLQLGRYSEGVQCLETLHKLSDQEPSAEYYLAVLYKERLDLKKAWVHYQNASAICAERGHFPRALKELKLALKQQLVTTYENLY